MNLHLSSLAALLLASYLPAQATVPDHSPSTAFIRSGLPIVDLDQWTEAQVVIDKEKGKYLGHPTTLLLKDGKTILCVYPKGHGSGEIILKNPRTEAKHGAKGCRFQNHGKPAGKYPHYMKRKIPGESAAFCFSAAFREETETQPPETGWRSVKTTGQHGPN